MLVAFASHLITRRLSKTVSKSVSQVYQNRSKTLFEVTCVLETLLGWAWNDFGLPNGVPKHFLEASSKPSKTFLAVWPSLRRPRSHQNGFWSLSDTFLADLGILEKSRFSLFPKRCNMKHNISHVQLE